MIALAGPCGSYAQKPSFTFDMMDSTENFTERRISDDGRWIAWGTSITEPRRPILRVQDMQTGRIMIFPNAQQARFSPDSRWAAFVVSGQPDTTLIIDLTTGHQSKMPGATAFQWAERSTGITAWLQPIGSGKQLTIANQQTENIVSRDVEQFWLRSDGSGVFFITKKAAGRQFYYMDIPSKRTDTITAAPISIGDPAFDADKERLAFAVSDSLKTGIILYDTRTHHSKRLAIENTGADTGYVVNEHTRLKFIDGTNLLQYTRQYRRAYRNAKVDDKVHVEIWSTADNRLYPQQKKELNRVLNQPYYFSYDPENDKTVQLTALGAEQYQLPADKQSGYALVTSGEPYYRQRQWDPVWRNDAWVVELKTGAAKWIGKNIAAEFSISPAGKFVVWFDREKSHYYCYEIQSGRTVQIDKGVTDVLTNNNTGMSQAPDPYGIALWKTGDSALLIHTGGDIWELDPQGKRAAVNMTRFASKQKAKLSFYAPLRPLSTYAGGDTLLVSFMLDHNKDAGFLAVTAGSSYPARTLIKGPYTYQYPGMAIANRTRQVLFSFGDNAGYGLYYTQDFTRFDTIYQLNKHQERYNRFRGELVRWKIDKQVMGEGALYKPENFDPKKKYPMIVWIYEQGHAKDINSYIVPGWSYSFINYAYYASNGYVIFVPDIHYVSGQPGESAYRTVMTGVDHLARQGWIDTTRLGMQGHSWGGYQVAYILTRTKRFRAASAGAIVSNMTSAYGGIRSNIGESRQWIYEKHQSRIGGSLWKYRDRYIANSPLFFADRITAPLLLIHNESDGGVPFAQGVEMFSALRRFQRPAWLLNYPEENHLVNQPANKKDFTRRMFQFFEHYLQGKPAPAWMTEGISAMEENYLRKY